MNVDEYNAQVAAAMSEAQLQALVLKAASVTGWLRYHTHDSRRSQAGYPDLTLVRGERLLFAELKSQKGRVRPEQTVWMQALMQVSGIEVHLWRPADWVSGAIRLALE